MRLPILKRGREEVGLEDKAVELLAQASERAYKGKPFEDQLKQARVYAQKTNDELFEHEILVGSQNVRAEYLDKALDDVMNSYMSDNDLRIELDGLFKYCTDCELDTGAVTEAGQVFAENIIYTLRDNIERDGLKELCSIRNAEAILKKVQHCITKYGIEDADLMNNYGNLTSMVSAAKEVL